MCSSDLSPIDMSALSTLQQQLSDSESKLRSLSESHAAREDELLRQIHDLKQISTHRELPDQPPSVASMSDDEGNQLSQLQQEVADWRYKHDSAVESMKASEKQLLATISNLEANLRDAEAQASRSGSPSDEHESEKKQQQQQEVVESLRRELEEHKSTAGLNATRLMELEQSHQKILAQVEEDARAKELTEKELETHRSLVANLENQLAAHQSSMTSHQEALEELKQSHSRQMDEFKAEALKARTESNEKLMQALEEHKQASQSLQTELEKVKASNEESKAALQAEISKAKEKVNNVMADAALILQKPADLNNITSHIQSLINARKDISAMHETASSELMIVREELEELRTSSEESERRLAELKAINEETLRELERMSDKERKSSRLVEELEEQLNSNYDTHLATNNRLSALQTERQEALQSALSDLDDARSRIAQLESELSAVASSHRDSYRDGSGNDELQRSNTTKTQSADEMRKSVSPVNLPSPPPAIPLPPLPGPTANGGTSSLPTQPAAANPSANSPPSSRHQSKDLVNAQLLEDQEARIRTIEKHWFAEKQLTATLEEALTDLESSSQKMKTEMEA